MHKYFSLFDTIGYTGEISAGIAGGAVVILILVSLVLYRNWRYEQELDSLLWKVDYKEIQMHENDKDNNSQQKQTRVWSGKIYSSKKLVNIFKMFTGYTSFDKNESSQSKLKS